MVYDRNGNLTALKRYGDTGLENNLTFTRSGNRMTALSDAGSPGGTITFAYDALGNMTQDGRKGLVFSYNVLNLPRGVVTSTSGSLTYTYLSDGTKVSAIKSDGSGERYIGSFVYSVPASGSETLESAAWDEGRISFTKSGSTYTKTDLWFVKDHVGNVRTVVNITPGLSAPQVVERNDYLPFGTRMNAGTAVLASNRFRLGGKESQTFGSLDLGKVDFGARMYDPFTAGWTTADPLAIAQRPISPYAYCLDNPLIVVDQDGRIGETLWDLVNVVMDAKSLVSNIKEGKTGAAFVDAGGLIFDLAAVVLPVVPGGAGTAIKAIRGVDKTVDAVNTVDNVSDVVKASDNVVDVAGSINKGNDIVHHGETQFTKYGRQAHKDYMPGEGYKKEVTLPSGKRADAVNFEKGDVRELKPNNPKAIKRGERQVQGYMKELQELRPDIKWEWHVDTYKRN